MTCPICKSNLYEKDRRETTGDTFITIRCTNPTCNYYDYKTIPVNFGHTLTTDYEDIKLTENVC